MKTRNIRTSKKYVREESAKLRKNLDDGAKKIDDINELFKDAKETNNVEEKDQKIDQLQTEFLQFFDIYFDVKRLACLYIVDRINDVFGDNGQSDLSDEDFKI